MPLRPLLVCLALAQSSVLALVIGTTTTVSLIPTVTAFAIPRIPTASAPSSNISENINNCPLLSIVYVPAVCTSTIVVSVFPTATPSPILNVATASDSSTNVCNDINNCRTLVGIVSSCLATIFACVWIAVHPNIPGPERAPLSVDLDGRTFCSAPLDWFVRIFPQKWLLVRTALAVCEKSLKIMVIAIMVPEFILAWAMVQRLGASRLAEKLEAARVSVWGDPSIKWDGDTCESILLWVLFPIDVGSRTAGTEADECEEFVSSEEVREQERLQMTHNCTPIGAEAAGGMGIVIPLELMLAWDQAGAEEQLGRAKRRQSTP